jgi:hypothetical protein
MTRLPSDDQLRALGLERSRLGETVVLDWPEAAAAHGRGLTDMAIAGLTVAGIIAAPDYGGLHFGRAAVPAAEALGISIDQAEEDRRILKVSCASGAPAIVRVLPPLGPTAPPDQKAWARDPEDLATVLLDVRPWVSSGGAVLLPGGDGLLITIGEDGRLRLTEVVAGGPRTPPVEIAAPVASWLSDEHPPWLRRAVETRLGQPSPWRQAAAVGLVARLAAPLRAAPAAADLAGPRRWVRGLGPGQLDALELLLRTEVERLLLAAADLARTMACDDRGWRSALVELCQGRDDVEGVRILLNEAGAGAALAGAIRDLDDAGARLVRSLPVRLRIDDARLREVRALDEAAWWALLARREG